MEAITEEGAMAAAAGMEAAAVVVVKRATHVVDMAI